MKLALALIAACGPAAPFSLELPHRDAGAATHFVSPAAATVCHVECGVYWADGSWRCGEICE